MKGNVIDALADKVRQEADEKVPHRADKIEKKKAEDKKIKEQINSYKQKIKELEKESNKWNKKYNRKNKEMETSGKKIRNLENFISKQDKEMNSYVKKLKQVKYELDTIKKDYQSCVTDLSNTKEELFLYQEREKKQKEQGLHVPTVLEEFEQYKKEKSLELQRLRNENKLLKTKNKRVREHLKGVNKRVEKDKRKKVNQSKVVREKDQRIRKLLAKQGEYKQQVAEYRKRFDSLREQATREKTFEDMVQELLDNLSTDTVSDFSGVEKLYREYKRTLQQKKREDSIEGVKNGYILKEGKTFFMSLDESPPRKLNNPKRLRVNDGDACRVFLIKGGTAELDYIYQDTGYSNTRLTVEEKLKLKETSNLRKGKKYKVNEKFMEVVYDKQVIVISAKGLDRYKEYLGRYGNVIKFINPYDTGTKSVFSSIDKADVVVVRPDAVAHSITDYIKENAKDKTTFVYNASAKDVTSAIYRGAVQVDS